MASAEFECRPPTILNVTLGIDDLYLTCTAQGDPAPDIAWSVDNDNHSALQAPVAVNGSHFIRRLDILVVKPGNYTCLARNIAGNMTSTYGVKEMQAKTRNVLKLETIKILETRVGFALTCLLLVILGYLLRVT